MPGPVAAVGPGPRTATLHLPESYGPSYDAPLLSESVAMLWDSICALFLVPGRAGQR